MREINWYNPETSVYPAIAQAQRDGTAVAPWGVPKWLLGVAPGTPALPPAMPEAAGVRRPTQRQVVRATFGYGEAGCSCARVREAGQAAPSFDNVRLAMISIAPEMEFDVREINSLDWNDPATKSFAITYLTNILQGVCGVPAQEMAAALYVTGPGGPFALPAFRDRIINLIDNWCPEYLLPTFEYQGPDPDADPPLVPGTNIVQDQPPGTTTTTTTTTRDEPPEEKKGYPVWGYALAGAGGLLVLGGIAYAVTRER